MRTGTCGCLKRLKDWDGANAENIQAAFDGLKGLGCTPHAAGPGTRAQARISSRTYGGHTPGHPSGSVDYLNAATFSFAGTCPGSSACPVPLTRGPRCASRSQAARESGRPSQPSSTSWEVTDPHYPVAPLA